MRGVTSPHLLHLKTCGIYFHFCFVIEEIKPERNIFFVHFGIAAKKSKQTENILILQSAFSKEPAEEIVLVKILTGLPQ